MTASVVLSEERPVASVRTKAWEKALARASIKDFTWHGLWHTWASWRVRHWRFKEFGGWAGYAANMGSAWHKNGTVPAKNCATECLTA